MLLFWNKEGQAEAEEMDTMAEVVSSAAQMIWEMGETFTLGWQQNEESCYMPVGTEEELQRAIAQMLKGEVPVEEQTQNTYAKVIGFGMENQEEGNLPDELKRRCQRCSAPENRNEELRNRAGSSTAPELTEKT